MRQLELQRPVFGFVGRLSAAKGLLALVRAWCQAALSQGTLLLIGSEAAKIATTAGGGGTPQFPLDKITIL
ncbi:MAG TPA: hypothetical protein EYP85_17135 [Armatimonadetes bacterium]|nr:hypothetical protein [Armatimonadota bacterium]